MHYTFKEKVTVKMFLIEMCELHFNELFEVSQVSHYVSLLECMYSCVTNERRVFKSEGVLARPR